MTVTAADFFCGAGGSSSGLAQVPNLEVKAAANHWELAVQVRSANHPGARHFVADISKWDPRSIPHTDMAWLSPECTNHSLAKAQRAWTGQPDLFEQTLPPQAAERSRATMWDVHRFAEYHRYGVVMVENVVESTRWAGYRGWRLAMQDLGYECHVLSLNSMHAQLTGLPAPQSRDRVYFLFWRAGMPRPEVERLTRPLATCPTHGRIEAMQAFKNGRTVGKYRQQYVYRCPRVECRNTIVEPGWLPAAAAIDWTLPGQRIGDRARPLAPKTLARIQAGIDLYWNTPDALAALAVPVEGRAGKHVQSTANPLRTMTTRNETGLMVPCGGAWRDQVTPTGQPMSTRTTRESDGVAMAPFIAELRGGGSVCRSTRAPLATVTASGNHHGLVTMYNGHGATYPTGQALPTVTTIERHALLRAQHPDHAATRFDRPVRIEDVAFRMLEPREIASAMGFQSAYQWSGTRRERVRLAGNAVTPPAARDIGTVMMSAFA